jgi:hypothetical protein
VYAQNFEIPKSGIYLFNRKHPLTSGFLALVRFDGNCLLRACTATWLAKRSHLLKLIDAPSRLLYIGKINLSS